MAHEGMFTTAKDTRGLQCTAPSGERLGTTLAVQYGNVLLSPSFLHTAYVPVHAHVYARTNIQIIIGTTIPCHIINFCSMHIGPLQD